MLLCPDKKMFRLWCWTDLRMNPPPTSPVTLGKVSDLSESQFPHLWSSKNASPTPVVRSEQDNGTSLSQGFFPAFITTVKFTSLAHSK